MVIKIDKFFSFFALALIGMEEVRDVSRDGVIGEDDVFLPGIYVSDESMALRRIRQTRDILSHSVRKYIGVPEVDDWLKKVGGMRRLDEILVGKEDLRSYIGDLRFVRDQMGYTPSALGEPSFVETDSATSNSGYSVQAHRTLKNRQHHGEVDFDDEENTTPSWALSEFDFDLKETKDGAPWWWKKIAIGKFSPTVLPKVEELPDGFIGPANKVYPKADLVQVPTGGPMWRPDFRISKLAGDRYFTQVNRMMPDFLIQEHPLIKEFEDRFYNSPSSLLWFYMGFNGYVRHACAMRIAHGPKEGMYIWSPLSTKSSASKDWWEKNDGKEEELKYSRALYYKEWIIAYRKVGTVTIEVRGFKESGSGHGLMLMSNKEMHWEQWGRTKRRLVKDGASDAYFGKPWKLYEEKRHSNAKPVSNYADAWNSL